MSSAANQPEQIVAVMGRGVVPAGSEVITADDLGFTRGEGVFDATRVVTSADGSVRVDHLDGHLARFNRSIDRIGGHFDEAAWRALIGQAVAVPRPAGEAVLKIMYSAGQESAASAPTQVLTITPIGRSTAAQRAGIAVRTLSRGYASDAFADAPWLLGGVKTLAYAVNVAAKHAAHAAGDDDVLFVSSDGYALEGPTSTLVVWRDGGLVTTPLGATGVLASVTQAAVTEQAQADGVSTAYELMRPAELLAAQSSWLLSSVRGVAPIHRLDGQPVPHDPALTARVAAWAGFED